MDPATSNQLSYGVKAPGVGERSRREDDSAPLGAQADLAHGCGPTNDLAPAARQQALGAMRRHLQTLAAEVDATRRGARFTAELEAMSRFWRYSPFNRYLIRLQRPTATRVAAASVWHRLGRSPKDGAKPISIFAPAPGMTPPFIVVSVFDLSQTQGQRLQSQDLLLKGETHHVATLETAAAGLGIAVVDFSGDGTVLGESVGGAIKIQRGLPDCERVATIAHELAHEILHQAEARRNRRRPLTRAQRETEADAAAYVVMMALGLPSKAPTYIAWQGGSGGMIGASMARIQRAARRILEAGGVQAGWGVP